MEFTISPALVTTFSESPFFISYNLQYQDAVGPFYNCLVSLQVY